MGTRDQVTRELDRTGLERDEAPGVESTSKKMPPEPDEEREVRGDTSMAKETATCDEDGDVVNLYDLGAVDYDPALHN
jgi:hypothetical protein